MTDNKEEISVVPLAVGKSNFRCSTGLCPWTDVLQHIYKRPPFQIEKTGICNYADDTTLFTCDRDINGVICRLDLMKLNEDKCHIITSSTNHTDIISLKISSSTVHEVTRKFEEYISTLGRKVSN